MLKLSKYIAKFYKAILVVICLLFIQSQSELSLPDYMSDIVTTGIQAGGFERAIPDVVSVDTFTNLLLFVDESNREFVESSYSLVEAGTGDQDLLSDFPYSVSNDVYVINELTQQQDDLLKDSLIRSMLVTIMFDSMDTSSDEYMEMMSQLPEGMTYYQALSMMPDKVLEILSEVDVQIETMGETTTEMAAASAVKNEYVALGVDIDQVQFDYILNIGVLMLVVTLVACAASMSVCLLASRIGAGLAMNLRKAVFEKVESFSNEEFNNFSTASLITRTTNDITQVQQVMVMILRIVCFAPMMGFGALIKAVNNSPSITWIIGLVLVVLFCVIGIIFSIVLPKFKIIQTLIDKLNLTTRENLSGMLVIRAFSNERYNEERFDHASRDLTNVNLFVNKAMSTLMPIMSFVMYGVTLLIVWYGSKQIDLGYLDIGSMMAFMQYTMQIIMAFLMMSMISIQLPRATVAAGRIMEVLNTTPKINDPVCPVVFDEDKIGYLEFKDVSFKYPGAQESVLENINFTVKPGETTAIIGSTGSGKSTLINLIPRFYEVTSGSVTFNGVDVREVKQHDLRERIGLVPQVGLLFSGTIKSNIGYGVDHISQEDLEHFADVAQATDFISKKEDGFDSDIAQGGSNVSGGQKQRISIARALAKKPDLFIFDDSFSALDFKTDAVLRGRLNDMIVETKQTVLIVGQRIASIMNANQIIVLDEGKMVGIGTHDELMKSCKVYQEIAFSQLSKEELANG